MKVYPRSDRNLKMSNWERMLKNPLSENCIFWYGKLIFDVGSWNEENGFVILGMLRWKFCKIILKTFENFHNMIYLRILQTIILWKLERHSIWNDVLVIAIGIRYKVNSWFLTLKHLAFKIFLNFMDGLGIIENFFESNNLMVWEKIFCENNFKFYYGMWFCFENNCWKLHSLQTKIML